MRLKITPITKQYCLSVISSLKKIGESRKVRSSALFHKRYKLIEYLRLIYLFRTEAVSLESNGEMSVDSFDLNKMINQLHETRNEFLEECLKYEYIQNIEKRYLFLFRLERFHFTKNILATSVKDQLLKAIAGEINKDQLGQVDKYLYDFYRYAINDTTKMGLASRSSGF